MIKAVWKSISNLGVRHVQNEDDKNVLRFINQFNFFAVLAIIGHSMLLQVQLHFNYSQVFYWELSYLPVAAIIQVLNASGYLSISRWIGSFAVVAYISLLYIMGGDNFGGSYLLLATVALPMIVFRNQIISTFFVILHVAAFFLVYTYQQHHSPLIQFTPEEQTSLYPGGVLFMFLIAFASIRYFINLNRSYAAELKLSKHLIEENKEDII